MHIAEGVLSAPILASGAVLAAAGIALGLRRLSWRELPLCGVMAAAFFVASLIHLPVGVGNAHLLLNGLAGVLLGWASFPVIFTALLLQGVLFQYGGLTTLGLNTFTMGSAAVCAWYCYRCLRALLPGAGGAGLAAFCGGALGVALAALLGAAALAGSSEGFRGAAIALLLAHIPVMIAEGLITMLTVAYLSRVRPDMLSGCLRASERNAA